MVVRGGQRTQSPCTACTPCVVVPWVSTCHAPFWAEVTWCTPKNVRSRTSTSPPVLTTPAADEQAAGRSGEQQRGSRREQQQRRGNRERVLAPARWAVSSSPVNGRSASQKCGRPQTAALAWSKGDTAQYRRPAAASRRPPATARVPIAPRRPPGGSAGATASGRGDRQRILDESRRTLPGRRAPPPAPPRTPPSETQTKYPVRCVWVGPPLGEAGVAQHRERRERGEVHQRDQQDRYRVSVRERHRARASGQTGATGPRPVRSAGVSSRTPR